MKMSAANRTNWAMLALLLAPATFLMSVDRAVLTVAAAVLQQKFSLSLNQLGTLFACFYWAYAAMQLPAGLIVTRFGTRRSLFVAILLWSIMTAITPFMWSFYSLLLVRIFLGVGQSLDWPAGIVGVTKLFADKDRPIANSILLFALYSGSAAGAPLTSTLLAAHGLTFVFLLFGGVGLILSIIWLSFYRDKGASVDLPQKPLFTAPTSNDSLITRLDVLGSPRCWTMAACYVCTAFGVSFYISWFASYLLKARGLSLQATGWYAGLVGVGLCVAVLIGGRTIRWLEARMHRTSNPRSVIGAVSLVVAAISSVTIPYIASNLYTVFAACLAIGALGFSQVITWSAVQTIGGQSTGVVVGVVATAGNFAAGAAPLLSAMLVSSTGSWHSTFVAIFASGFIGAILWLRIAIKPIEPRSKERHQVGFTNVVSS